MNEWSEWIDWVVGWLAAERVSMIVRATTVLLVGLAAARLIGRRVGMIAERQLDRQSGMIARRASYYGIMMIAVLWAMGELNFRLSVILGTAGVLSVALGFASQTSASNLISGLFLIGERAFAVGDVIRVGQTTGEVLAIDWLSVKLRTFDNLYVRVPNENMIKSEVTNLSRFPIRRFDLELNVGYGEDLARVRRILLELADREPTCLQEPSPLIVFTGFADSAVVLQFSVWSTQANFLKLKNTISEGVKTRFAEAGIEIPFPQRSLSAAGGEPLPVRLVDRLTGAAGSGTT